MRGLDWKLALAGALFSAVAFAAGTAPSQAASRMCNQLQAELAALSGKRAGGPKLLAKYDDAIARQRRELELLVSGQVQDAIGSVERWRLAEQAAATARETARLTQKAYTAGEADVQALLLVRRQALEAATTANAARAEALRARYRLQIDAGLLWPGSDRTTDR